MLCSALTRNYKSLIKPLILHITDVIHIGLTRQLPGFRTARNPKKTIFKLGWKKFEKLLLIVYVII